MRLSPFENVALDTRHEPIMESFNVHAIAGFREPFSSLSHLVAIPVFAVLGYFLVLRGRGSRWRVASLATMAISTVFLLSMSAVYHLLGAGMGRYVMGKLDMAGVFVLIAGIVTPIHTILFRGWSRWAPIVLVWSAAVAGIALRTVFAERLASAGNAIFLLLGWSGLISCVVLWRRYGFTFIKPLLGGGVAYTLGVVILALNWPTLIPNVFAPHELWHIAVLCGLGLHWKFVFQFAGGAVEPLANSQRRTFSTRAPIRLG